MKIPSSRHFVPIVFILLCITTGFDRATAADLPNTMSFEGILSDSAGNPMTGPVTLSFQIYDPSGTCLLYEESQSGVAVDTDGFVSVKIGSGTRTANDPALLWRTIFQNDVNLRAAGTSGCAAGYTPVARDARRLRVSVGATSLTPDFILSAVPMASVAESLQGKLPTDFVSVTGTSNMTGPLKLATQNEIRFFDSGSNYIGFKAPVTVGTSRIWTLPSADGTSGQILSTNGGGVLSWITPAGGGSGITSFNGLTSGTQTLANGTTGTQPSWNSAGSVHTLNIPMASSAGVTAGLISKSDYDAFTAKQASLGFNPVNEAGHTMTGYLTLNADPTLPLHAATRQYVDAAVSGGVGAVSSVFGRSGAIVAQTGDYTFSQINGSVADAQLSSNVAFVTNANTFSAPTNTFYNTTNTRVTVKAGSSQSTSVFEVLNAGGAVLSKIDSLGYIYQPGAPSAASNQAATTNYVDAAISGGTSNSVKRDGSVGLTSDWDVANFQLQNISKIGVGTSSPVSRLDVQWQAGDATATAHIGSPSAGNSQKAIVAESYGANAIDAISTSGNGVQGSSNGSPTMAGLLGMGVTSAAGVIGKASAGDAVRGMSASGSSGVFQADSGANTNPTLRVLAQTGQGGSVRLVDVLNASATSIFSIQNDGLIKLGPANNLTIASSGNVGIGTLNPAAPLDVQGMIQLNAGGGPGLVVNGMPPASSTSSLIQLNNPLSGGNPNGTLIGANVSGGFTGNLLDFQIAGTSVASIDSQGMVMLKSLRATTISSGVNIVPTGATANFALGNTAILQSVGGPTISLIGLIDGSDYTIIVSDTTSRTYTFSGCTSMWGTANAATTVSTTTIYKIKYANTKCYIDWKSGYL